MAAGEKTPPRVYLFKDDYDMIHELVRRRPTEKTGGDLFGLWTSDDEPVLHIITSQGIEIIRSPQQVFSSNDASVDSRIVGLSAKLDKFHLVHLGKWQYKRLSEQTEAEIIAMVGQKTLSAKAGMRDFLFILASCDIQSSKVELNPYFLSQFSTPTRGEIADALPGRGIFKKDDDIASTVDSLIFREDKGNRASFATKQPAGENGKEMEARPSEIEPSPVEMRAPYQKGGYENQPLDKITSKSPETFLENGDPNLKLYIFREHRQMIKDAVGCHPDAEAGGDLYGLWTNNDEPVLHRVTNAKNPATEIEILPNAVYLDCVGRWKYMRVGENVESAIEEAIHKSTRPDERGSVFLIVERSEEKIMSAFLRSDEYSSPRKMEIELLDRRANKEEKCPDKDDRFEETDRGERRACSDLAVPVVRRSETGFTCNPYGFKVHLFQDDYEMMRELVLRHPNVETGGDLFGLWTSDGDAVLQMVLGPGQNCKRTPTSFYQDIPYLQDKGEMLTTRYMLCHIGEWHSHHKLHLYEPSHGDSSTVIRNYPRGTCGFLLIIANILSHDTVELSPYLYTARSVHNFCQKGELVCLNSPNAFKNGLEISRIIREGREEWPNRCRAQYFQHPHYYTRMAGGSSQSIEPPMELKYDTNNVPMETD